MPERSTSRGRRRVSQARGNEARPGRRLVVGAAIVLLLLALPGVLLLATRLTRDRIAADPSASHSAEPTLPYRIPPRPDLPLPDEGPAEGSEVAQLRDESFQVAESVVRALPTSPDAICLLATVHYRHANPRAANALWQACLKLDHRFADAYQMLGTAAMNQGDPARAEELFRQALELSPDWPAVPIPLAEALLCQGKASDAVEVLKRYQGKHPDDAEAWRRLGDVHQQRKELDKARQCYESALRIDPQCADVCYSLALVLTALGHDAQAASYREKFEQLGTARDQQMRALRPNFDDVWRMRTTLINTHMTAARVYLRHGRPTAAERHFRRAADLDGEHRESRELLCIILEQRNDVAAALKVRRELCRIAPEDSHYWLQTGLLHHKVGQVDEAERAFRRVVELAPQQAEGYLTLAQILMEPGKDPSEAVKLARKGVELEPTAPHYHILAKVCQHAGDVAAARQAMARAVQLDPRNPQYQHVLRSLREQRQP